MLTNQGAGICFAMVGLSAWRLRPSTPAGLLMTLMAELILISNLAIGLGLATDMPGSSLVVTLGAIAQWALFALAAQLLLGVAAPTTAKAWTPHKLVKIAWMLAAAGPILLLPLKTPVAICGNWCGQSPFHWNDDASLYLSVRSLYMGAWIILAVCGAGVITRRFNQATARQRRTHGLALASAGTVMMLFVLMQLSVLAQYLWADTTINQVGGAIAFTTAIIMVIAVPVAFTAAVLGEQATLAGIAQLLGRAKPLTPPELEEALQTTLRDPSLCLALLPPQSAPFIHSARSQTPIGNPPVGVLLHDRSLLDEPHLLNAAINAAHLVIQQWSSRPLGSERPMA